MSTKKILDARAKTHGSFEANAQMSQAIKELIATGDVSLTDTQREAIDMIALKLSRIATGNPNVRDHWADIAGYATLVANTLED
jgi:hypothetical protein